MHQKKKEWFRHNCGDVECYRDLARLRGIEYRTWENDELIKTAGGIHPQLRKPHKKFMNYWFDKNEFMRLVSLVSEIVSIKCWPNSVKVLFFPTSSSVRVALLNTGLCLQNSACLYNVSSVIIISNLYWCRRQKPYSTQHKKLGYKIRNKK